MSFYQYEFTGQIVTHNLGTYVYTVVFLPPDLQDELPLNKYPRLRMSGEIGEVPIEGAWQPSKGHWYLMLSRPLMKAGNYSLGDEVDVRFNVVDQDAVEVPDELALALDRDEAASQAWDQLTPGKRRGLAHRVASAKTAPTRSRRLAEVLNSLKSG
ncbi:MAG: YdeI/OmpD-associated family protein [Cyanobacteria bacterium J06639_14]